MDMSNATAAGPSYGILDVIMGNVPKEGKAEGKEFEPMLQVIEALNKKKEEDSSADSGRTDKETSFGSNTVDYRFVNAPGMSAAMSSPDNQALLQWAEAQGMPRERAEATLLLATMKAQAKQRPVEQQAAVVLSQGMQELPPEQQEVWSKYLAASPLATAPLAENAIGEMDAYQSLASSGLLGKREKDLVMAKAAIPEGVFVKEALEGAPKAEMPVNNRAAEKIMSTQDYLQLQKQMNSPAQNQPAKHVDAPPQPVKQDAAASAAAGAVGSGAAALASKNSKPSAEDGAMSEERKSSEKEKPQLKTVKAEAKGLDSTQEFPSAVNAETGVKAAGSIMAKEIFLTGTKHNEIRSGLMDEVAHSVRAQAVKGGGEMKLIIHPDNLGELKLKVSTRENKVEVSVTADNEQVAGILKKSADDLRSALSDQNLALAKFDVKIADNTTNAMSNSQGGGMENFFSQQHQMNQDFRGGMSGQEGGRFAQGQEFSGGRSYGSEEVKGMSKQKTAAPARIKTGTNRLDVVA